MQSYKDLTKYFGTALSDSVFQDFLKENFEDLTKHNVTESSYIISKQAKIELGFQNKQAVFDEDDEIVFEEGDARFSTINIFFPDIFSVPLFVFKFGKFYPKHSPLIALHIDCTIQLIG